MLLELSTAADAGVSLDVGLAAELCPGFGGTVPELETPGLTAELKAGLAALDIVGLETLEPGTTAELKSGFWVATLELLSTPGTKSVEDDKIFECVGAIGVDESSPHPKNTAITLAAHKEYNKRFFIVFLFTPRLKLDFIVWKGTKKSFLKRVFVSGL